jgi:hypothetical protein
MPHVLHLVRSSFAGHFGSVGQFGIRLGPAETGRLRGAVSRVCPTGVARWRSSARTLAFVDPFGHAAPAPPGFGAVVGIAWGMEDQTTGTHHGGTDGVCACGLIPQPSGGGDGRDGRCRSGGGEAERRGARKRVGSRAVTTDGCGDGQVEIGLERRGSVRGVGRVVGLLGRVRSAGSASRSARTTEADRGRGVGALAGTQRRGDA